MPKILTDTELIEIIKNAPEEIDDNDQYVKFLQDLGELVANHFGGECGMAERSGMPDLLYSIAFRINDSVPPDGGVYAKYDKDIVWADGVETEKM